MFRASARLSGERAAYDENGQLLTGSLADYLVPTASDMPVVELHHTEIPSTLNELAMASGVSITVQETAVPVREQVRGASEMLGYDVFHYVGFVVYM